MARIPDPKDAEIARLTAELVRLKSELEQLRGRIGARQPLALLREDNGSININKVKTPPAGYVLLRGPGVEAAIRRNKVAHAPVVRYFKSAGAGKKQDAWDAAVVGWLVEEEQAHRIGDLAQEIEAGRASAHGPTAA
jgi:HAMP domain-containing protein